MEPDPLGSDNFHGLTSAEINSLSDYAPFLTEWKRNVASVRCSRELCGPQEVEIARRIQLQVLHPIRVH